jgi:hypothetical protein
MGVSIRTGLIAASVIAVATAPVVAAPVIASSTGQGSTIGAPGVGDPFFPLGGNGGIDVADYGLDLAYDPASRHLQGTATLGILATQNLSRFDLDLRGFQVGKVTVNGLRASARRDGQELVITPPRLIRKGSFFTVVVPYAGTPETVIDPDGSSEGWVYTDDGAVVVGEPQGSPAWYPANDTPRDKATYTVRMTDRGRQRGSVAPVDPRRAHDLHVAGAVPDGDVPVHDHSREVRRQHGPDRQRGPDLRGDRSDPGA